ncbi:MAG: amidohydrolase family protein [Sandaracinaceae bacterium]
MRVTLSCLLATLALTGCPRPYGEPDGGDDGGVPMGDASVDAGPPPGDAGPLPEMSEPTPPAEIVSMGTAGLLLRGTVLAPDEVIAPGEVLVVGQEIVCVAASCAGEPEASTATVIETNGIISPGLINAHDHITYDFLPEWEPGMLFQNRDEWPATMSYQDHVAPRQDDPVDPMDGLYGQTDTERQCAGAVWGELRSIIHGTTTVQGQTVSRTCFDRLARNAENYHGLSFGNGNLRTSVRSVEINSADAIGYADSFVRTTNRAQRFAVHMQEGISGLEDEFESWAGRPPSGHEGLSLLEFMGSYMGMSYDYRGVSVLIHSVSLTDAQLVEVAATGSHIVWSPSSNLALYGETADIARILELDISLALGPDWTPSGEDEMLSEMRFADAYGRANGVTALTAERLWRMATSSGAYVLAMDSAVGTLAPGMRADIAVFGRRGQDPYRALMDSRAQDVRLVLIDGAGYYGDAALEAATAVNAECDSIDACGTSKYLCVANVPQADGDPSSEAGHLDDLRQNLEDMISRYASQGAELLDLIACE